VYVQRIMDAILFGLCAAAALHALERGTWFWFVFFAAFGLIKYHDVRSS
jgi:hypothetical protein